MTKNKDEATIVELRFMYSEGYFGVNIDRIMKIAVVGKSIYVWFNEEAVEDDSIPYDLDIPFESEFSADRSYEEFMKVRRKLNMKRIK